MIRKCTICVCCGRHVAVLLVSFTMILVVFVRRSQKDLFDPQPALSAFSSAFLQSSTLSACTLVRDLDRNSSVVKKNSMAVSCWRRLVLFCLNGYIACTSLSNAALTILTVSVICCSVFLLLPHSSSSMLIEMRVVDGLCPSRILDGSKFAGSYDLRFFLLYIVGCTYWQIVFRLSEEMAITIEDIVLRRCRRVVSLPQGSTPPSNLSSASIFAGNFVSLYFLP